MKSFVDANILLEILLVRPSYLRVKQFLTGQERLHFVSPLSVHLCYYYGLKEGVDADRLEDFLNNFEILPIDTYVVKLAQQRLKGADFEDCLQAACAEIGDCAEIFTLDKTFEKASGTKLKVTVI